MGINLQADARHVFICHTRQDVAHTHPAWPWQPCAAKLRQAERSEWAKISAARKFAQQSGKANARRGHIKIGAEHTRLLPSPTSPSQNTVCDTSVARCIENPQGAWAIRGMRRTGTITPPARPLWPVRWRYRSVWKE